MPGDLTADFSRWEFRCKCGCGVVKVDEDALGHLQIFRTFVGRRVTLNSSDRCKKHNAAVGGSPRSRHMHGDGFDVVVENMGAETVAWVALAMGWTGVRVYRKPDRTHIDRRPGPIYRMGF